MQVNIINCPDKDFKPFVRRAVEFYAKNLIPSNRLRDNIHLTIKFNQKLKVWAFASIEEYNASNYPDDKEIDVNEMLESQEEKDLLDEILNNNI